MPVGERVGGSAFDGDEPEADEVPISALLSKVGDRAVYWYDFGDDWVHELRVEGTRMSDFTRQLLGGELAFPAEDSGGLPGYERSVALVRAREAGETLGVEDAHFLDELGLWHPDDFDFEEEAKAFNRRAEPSPMLRLVEGTVAKDVPMRPDPAPAITVDTIIGGMRLSGETIERCHAAWAAVATLGPVEEDVSFVRGVARAELCQRWLDIVRGSIPRDFSGMANFDSLCDALDERIDELAYDDPGAAADFSLALAEFYVAEQSNIPWDDDLGSSAVQCLARGVGLEMQGVKGIRPLRPLFTRVAAMIEADDLDILAAAGPELLALRFRAPQRRRIAETLREAAGKSPMRPDALEAMARLFDD